MRQSATPRQQGEQDPGQEQGEGHAHEERQRYVVDARTVAAGILFVSLAAIAWLWVTGLAVLSVLSLACLGIGYVVGRVLA